MARAEVEEVESDVVEVSRIIFALLLQHMQPPPGLNSEALSAGEQP